MPEALSHGTVRLSVAAGLFNQPQSPTFDARLLPSNQGKKAENLTYM